LKYPSDSFAPGCSFSAVDPRVGHDSLQPIRNSWAANGMVIQHVGGRDSTSRSRRMVCCHLRSGLLQCHIVARLLVEGVITSTRFYRTILPPIGWLITAITLFSAQADAAGVYRTRCPPAKSFQTRLSVRAHQTSSSDYCAGVGRLEPTYIRNGLPIEGGVLRFVIPETTLPHCYYDF